jgi:hypothetical protein
MKFVLALGAMLCVCALAAVVSAFVFVDQPLARAVMIAISAVLAAGLVRRLSSL